MRLPVWTGDISQVPSLQLGIHADGVQAIGVGIVQQRVSCDRLQDLSKPGQSCDVGPHQTLSTALYCAPEDGGTQDNTLHSIYLP